MIRSFNVITRVQQLAAGGKGKTLVKLYKKGYPVPDGFIILPTAFSGDKLKQEAWKQIKTQVNSLHKKEKELTFAVRSSAVSEDSIQASFAGEFETILNVHGNEMMKTAIEKVRQSRHSERVQSYSETHGLEILDDMAVILQRMVKADISGVLFTADPVIGANTEMIGNFVFGVGDKLMSGEVEPHKFKLERSKGQYDGPPALMPFSRRLYKLACQLEKELGSPQDIEWAIADGKLFLLQSRPITTLQGYNPALGEWNDSLTGDFLWSNVNFGEAIPDVMTPFTWSIVSKSPLGDRVKYQNYCTIGNICGRPYLNISIFASLFQVFGKKEKEMLEMIEGVLHLSLPKGLEVPLLPFSRQMLLNTIPMMIATKWRQILDVRDLPSIIAANQALYKEMRQMIREVETENGLVSMWHNKIKPYMGKVWSAYFSGTNHYVDYTIKLRRELSELVGPDDADTLISGLSTDTELLASLGPLLGMYKVARNEMTRKEYLEQFGHRGSNEFELSTPRPIEDFSLLDRKLAEYENSPLNIETLLEKQQLRFDAAWERLSNTYPQKAKSIRRRIKEVSIRARLREAIRSEFGYVLWVIRIWALKAGELTGLGNDVFFLTVEEVLGKLSGHFRATSYISTRKETYEKYKGLPTYPTLIRGRFNPFQWAADPNWSSNFFDSHASSPISDEADSNTIIGAAGAAGKVEGLVRRLDNLEEGEQLLTGEVLVTTLTNIGWTLLFPRAAAIITDVGAPLSHTAIIARELGIPAVVGCGDATMRLKTGDRVRVDGGRGVVEILEFA